MIKKLIPIIISLILVVLLTVFMVANLIFGLTNHLGIFDYIILFIGIIGIGTMISFLSILGHLMKQVEDTSIYLSSKRTASILTKSVTNFKEALNELNEI